MPQSKATRTVWNGEIGSNGGRWRAGEGKHYPCLRSPSLSPYRSSPSPLLVTAAERERTLLTSQTRAVLSKDTERRRLFATGCHRMSVTCAMSPQAMPKTRPEHTQRCRGDFRSSSVTSVRIAERIADHQPFWNDPSERPNHLPSRLPAARPGFVSELIEFRIPFESNPGGPTRNASSQNIFEPRAHDLHECPTFRDRPVDESTYFLKFHTRIMLSSDAEAMTCRKTLKDR
jgi:hypothetical protein